MHEDTGQGGGGGRKHIISLEQKVSSLLTHHRKGEDCAEGGEDDRSLEWRRELKARREKGRRTALTGDARTQR